MAETKFPKRRAFAMQKPRKTERTESPRRTERQRAAELANLEKALRLCREIGISYTSVQALTNKVYKEESSC